MFSCSNEIEDENINESTITDNIELTSTEESLSNFANILSKVVAENKDVRVFLKEESLKEFDNNTDVLYYLISDQKIGDKTFREILVNASSEEEIAKIEETVPLLNIHNVRVAFLDVYPENMDVDDNEIPVAVSMPNGNYFYFNGEKEVAPKGEIPGFNLFFVGINNRVEIPEEIFSTKNKSIKKFANSNQNVGKTINFRHPEYDGLNNKKGIKKEIVSTENCGDVSPYIGKKATEAYKYFYKNDGSINQVGLQRDYIYYGITPTNQKGAFNNSIRERLSYIRIPASTYFVIADEIEGSGNTDPYIKKSSYTNKSSSLTEQQQKDKLWQWGIYSFRFEVFKSNNSIAQTVIVDLYPDQIWDFNISYSKKSATLLKHSQHTYKIDASKFSPKNVWLKVDFGKWNIKEESLLRHVKVYEEDSGKTITDSYEKNYVTAKDKNFSGSNKVNIGLKLDDILDLGNETSWSTTFDKKTTKDDKHSTTYTYTQNSDLLGETDIYFYDPIIYTYNNYRNIYTINTYNLGRIEFAITAY